MSDATFDLTGSPQLQALETVSVFAASNIGGGVVDSQVLDASGEATFDGLEWDTEYVARGATSGREVRFRTPPDPMGVAATERAGL
jgi:hypothetical protein